jgi:hypothetical protein
MELIAPLCTTQAEGLVFFYIPNRPSQVNVRERDNTTIVTMLKGSLTTKQIDDEFTRILSGVWRWIARKVADKKFIVRFPNQQMIKDWEKFNTVKLRSVNAKIHIDIWNSSIGGKG